jgi:hypothetical protein
MHGIGFSENLTIQERNLDIVQRLARLEEGQKAIIAEMRARFEAVDKRFEAVDKRFDSIITEMNNRFESFEMRIQSMNDSMNKRMDSIENHVSNLDTCNLTILAAIIGFIGYITFDRKTASDATYSKIEQLFQTHIEQFHYTQPVLNQVSHEKKNNNQAFLDEAESPRYQIKHITVPRSIQEQFQNVVNFMNQFPETRNCMQAIA